MNKLKVCFLWHQHQPYYRVDNEFLLPWVLFHGTKDYFDIPEVLYEFPKIKQTFNFAPSLSLQIEEYIKQEAKDKIQNLTLIPANQLNDDNKREILNYFFACNYKSMIVPNRRYNELYNRQRNAGFNILIFSDQDWLDLQVLYNLVWFGYFSSNRNIVKRLLDKGSNYTEEEKKLLIREQLEVLDSINKQYRKLNELGQISLSCSPMFHPILPLLINSESALESLPDNELPNPLFNYPDDADLQIKSGMYYFEKTFGNKPVGIWPSEGSISNETLELLIKNNVKWVASDELVLANSINDNNGLNKYFPYKFKREDGEITLFFRDHNLSDKIGFVYSNWNENDAAHDFVNNLKNIRNSLISSYGDQVLDEAVVSIILDGENCWEYYKDNGIPFLRSLFGLLQQDGEIETVLFDEIVSENKVIKEITKIQAGSWINGNFSIWIGDNEDVTAWNLLSETRQFLENKKTEITEDIYKNAIQSIMIAEGSDWFWWYGPEHPADNKPIFDYIFRYYLKNVYKIIESDYPEELDTPVWEQMKRNSTKSISGNTIESIFYNDGKHINNSNENTSMHRSDDLIKSVKKMNKKNKIYLEIDFDKNIKDIQDLEIEIKGNYNNSFKSYFYRLEK